VLSNIDSVWILFLAGFVSLTIVVVAFAAAMVIAQRRRLALQKDYALRVLTAHEDERAWVARELHDDMLQRVAMIRHELDSLWATLSSAATPKEAHSLRALNAELLDLGVALRGVAHRLHPTIVDQLGLPRALEALAGEFQRAASLEVKVTVPAHDAPIPPAIAHAAYRIAQEALRNTVKHSGAATAELALESRADGVRLRVRDHGRGFAGEADGRHGLGIASMRERAELVHGTVLVSSRPGEGTTIEAILPTAGK
jgi:two-component system NarL family sensor kinase